MLCGNHHGNLLDDTCIIPKAPGTLESDRSVMMKWTIVLVLLQTLTAFAVEVKVGSEGVTVKVGGKFLMPQIGLDVKIPKFLDELDSMDEVDVGVVDVLKNITDKEYDENGELTCVNVMRKLALKGLPAFNACLKEMQLTVGRLRKQIKQALPCMVRCVGTKMNVFKEDGTFNFAFAPELLEENIPPRLHAVVGKALQTCFQHVKGINPNDSTCNTYRPLMKCLVDSSFQMADQVLDLCPDIPDVFKKTAKRLAKSRRVRQKIGKIIDPYGKF